MLLLAKLKSGVSASGPTRACRSGEGGYPPLSPVLLTGRTWQHRLPLPGSRVWRHAVSNNVQPSIIQLAIGSDGVMPVSLVGRSIRFVVRSMIKSSL